jgi:uncharacterized protein
VRIAQFVAAGLLALGLSGASAFAFDFPVLTGRVVDQANVISGDARSDIEAESKGLEDKSGTQLVIATVNSLQGSDIETYANELFRAWKLGQAQKNNGVLLLVAPNEHKVRIEVGYGLEGTLTDALASVIISSAIIPRFKTGDFSGGIEHGVDGIIGVLDGDSADWQPQAAQPTVRNDDSPGALNTLLPILGFLGVALVLKLMIIGIAEIFKRVRYGAWRFATPGHYVQRGNHRVFVPARHSSRSSDWSSASSSGSDSSSSSSSDSGFSGDGGSSGGGGASGSW